MMSEKKMTRRKYVSVAGGIVAVAVAGGAAYYYGMPQPTPTAKPTTTPTSTTSPTPSPAKRPVKFGIAAGITGRRSGVGIDNRDAILLAVEEINNAGGILGSSIETVVEDTVDQEAGMTASVFLKLIERDGADAIIAHWGNNACSEFDVVANAKMPYCTAGAIQAVEATITPNPTKYATIFGGLPSYNAYKTVYGEYINELEKNGKYKPINHKIAMITRSFEYSLFISQGLTKTFEGLGWTVSFTETLPSPKVEDWSAVLSKIRSDPPALIISTITDPSSDALFLKQFLEDPTPSLLYQQASPNDPEYKEMTKATANGILHVYGVKKVAKTDPYIVKYKNKFGREPSPYGIIGYDQAYLMKTAMEKAGDPFNRDAFGQAILTIDYKGVMGRYKFDPKTHLPLSGGQYIPFPVYQMWDSENFMIYPSEVAERDFAYPSWYQKGLDKYKK
jgi:branched-chain amino acid transport system substrate-binding protein